MAVEEAQITSWRNSVFQEVESLEIAHQIYIIEVSMEEVKPGFKVE